jgi:SprT protein
MAATEHPMQVLADFLPQDSFDSVIHFIHQFKVHLTITQKRKSVLGDYRHAVHGKNHRISINGNLNPYEFLITLLHELAHLLTFEKFGNRIEPHGKEWKAVYSALLADFVQKKIFPQDIEKALHKSIMNPAATANGEVELLMVLRRYDRKKREGVYHVAELPVGAVFQTEDGRMFTKGMKRRKRFECIEMSTGYKYTVSPISEVKWIQ